MNTKKIQEIIPSSEIIINDVTEKIPSFEIIIKGIPKEIPFDKLNIVNRSYANSHDAESTYIREETYVIERILQILQNNPKYRIIGDRWRFDLLRRRDHKWDVILFYGIVKIRVYKYLRSENDYMRMYAQMKYVKEAIEARWKKCRLLWIAYFKDKASPFNRKKLPKEMLHRIINFIVYICDENKKRGLITEFFPSKKMKLQ